MSVRRVLPVPDPAVPGESYRLPAEKLIHFRAAA